MKNLKKKVALFLALVMALAMVPSMNVFGASGVTQFVNADGTPRIHTLTLDLALIRDQWAISPDGINILLTLEGGSGQAVRFGAVEQVLDANGNMADVEAWQTTGTPMPVGAFDPAVAGNLLSVLNAAAGVQFGLGAPQFGNASYVQNFWFRTRFQRLEGRNGREALLNIVYNPTNRLLDPATGLPVDPAASGPAQLPGQIGQVPHTATGALQIPLVIRANHNDAVLVGRNPLNNEELFRLPLINPPQSGVTITRQGDVPTFETAVRLGAPGTNDAGTIRIMENQPGALTGLRADTHLDGTYTRSIRLLAPEGYRWSTDPLMGTTGGATVRTYRGAGSGFQLVPNMNGVGAGGYRFTHVGATYNGRDTYIVRVALNRVPGAAGNITDGLVISGLWLVPIIQGLPEGEINVDVGIGAWAWGSGAGEATTLNILPGTPANTIANPAGGAFIHPPGWNPMLYGFSPSAVTDALGNVHGLRRIPAWLSWAVDSAGNPTGHARSNHTEWTGLNSNSVQQSFETWFNLPVGAAGRAEWRSEPWRSAHNTGDFHQYVVQRVFIDQIYGAGATLANAWGLRTVEAVTVGIRTHIVGGASAVGQGWTPAQDNNAAWRNNIVVARRVAAGLTLSASAPTDRITGAFLGYGGYNAWSATITLQETTAGAWDAGAMFFLSQLNFNVVQEGVVITDVRARINRDNWDAHAGNITPSIGYALEGLDVRYLIGNSNAGSFNESGVSLALNRSAVGVTAPRRLDIQFRFNLEPGFAARHGNEVQIEVTGDALTRLPEGSQTVFTVMNAIDPVSVERVGNVAQAIVSGMMNVLEPTQLPNFVLTENVQGALPMGSEIWVYLGGGLDPFNINITAPVATVAPGSNLQLSTPVRRVHPTSGDVVWVFTVQRASFQGQQGVVTFSNMTAHDGFILPAVPYHVVFTGPAFARNDIRVGEVSGNASSSSAGNWVAASILPGIAATARFETAAYGGEVIVFGDFDLDYAHGIGGGQPGTGGPGTGQPAGPTPDFIIPVNRPSVVNAAPLMVGHNLVNLRGIQEVLGGTVTREPSPQTGRNLTAFTLPHAASAVTTVNIYNEEATVIVAGQPLTPGPFGVVRVDGSFYVMLSGLPALIGYTGVVNGNFLHLYAIGNGQ
ncbi:MAG: hypothetical protein FWC71_06065 [Defluviitaleaceae bacterium]|nr:hypothetical protein [Defluviitaleaceae bacterium]